MTPQVITLIIGAATGAGGLLALLVRGIIVYLFARIATLEKREENFNAAAAAVVTNLNASLNEVSKGVLELVEDLRFRERMRQQSAATGQQSGAGPPQERRP